MNIRPMSAEERLYVYYNSQTISSKTGLIGHLSATIGTLGECLSTWYGFRDDLKTDEFKTEFDEVLAVLRAEGKPLENRASIAQYCAEHADAMIYCESEYGITVTTDKYAYLMRLEPFTGHFNFTCFCYVKDWLYTHIEAAKSGIRFITPDYETLFVLRDGEKVRITFHDGTETAEVCRYIDPTHLEVGEGPFSDIYDAFHICEFAEKMERAGAKVEPFEKEEE